MRQRLVDALRHVALELVACGVRVDFPLRDILGEDLDDDVDELEPMELDLRLCDLELDPRRREEALLLDLRRREEALLLDLFGMMRRSPPPRRQRPLP